MSWLDEGVAHRTSTRQCQFAFIRGGHCPSGMRVGLIHHYLSLQSDMELHGRELYFAEERLERVPPGRQKFSPWLRGIRVPRHLAQELQAWGWIEGRRDQFDGYWFISPAWICGLQSSGWDGGGQSLISHPSKTGLDSKSLLPGTAFLLILGRKWPSRCGSPMRTLGMVWRERRSWEFLPPVKRIARLMEFSKINDPRKVKELALVRCFGLFLKSDNPRPFCFKMCRNVWLVSQVIHVYLT